jgi:hypothetical protein
MEAATARRVLYTSSYWWAFVIVAVVIIVFAVVIAVVRRRQQERAMLALQQQNAAYQTNVYGQTNMYAGAPQPVYNYGQGVQLEQVPVIVVEAVPVGQPGVVYAVPNKGVVTDV